MVWIFSIVSGNTAQFSSVQLLSCVPLFVTPWTVAHQAFLFKFVSIESVMPSNHLILCRPLLLPPSVFPCIRIFSNQLVLCIRWPNIGASASVFPMNIQDWSPLGWTGWISLQSKGLSRVFSNTTVQKHQLMYWRREWQTTSVFFALRTPWTVWKGPGPQFFIKHVKYLRPHIYI